MANNKRIIKGFWIVFEMANPNDSSIHNYDPMRIFETEKEAMGYELANAEYRTRKYVSATNSKLTIFVEDSTPEQEKDDKIQK